MEESDIQSMLIAKYFVLTRVEGLEGSELYAAMEEFTNEVRIIDPDILKEGIDIANNGFLPDEL